MTIHTDAVGNITDQDTMLNRYDFWELNKHRAQVAKKTFYARIASGKFDSFEEAIAGKGSAKTTKVSSVSELNKKTNGSFFEEFVASTDGKDVTFGKQKIKAPTGA